MQFTNKGKKIFHTITRREAERGALVCQGQRDSNAVTQCASTSRSCSTARSSRCRTSTSCATPTESPVTTARRSTWGAAAGSARRRSSRSSCRPVRCRSSSRRPSAPTSPATLGKDSLTEAKKARARRPARRRALPAPLLPLPRSRRGDRAAASTRRSCTRAILLFHVTLTLPGFAGLILTIGVAADANVVIFERIKEEVRAGKSVRAAISAGYSEGLPHDPRRERRHARSRRSCCSRSRRRSVKGFALMLLIGTVISLITGGRRDARDARPARRLRVVRQPALHGRAGPADGEVAADRLHAPRAICGSRSPARSS